MRCDNSPSFSWIFSWICFMRNDLLWTPDLKVQVYIYRVLLSNRVRFDNFGNAACYFRTDTLMCVWSTQSKHGSGWLSWGSLSSAESAIKANETFYSCMKLGCDTIIISFITQIEQKTYLGLFSWCWASILDCTPSRGDNHGCLAPKIGTRNILNLMQLFCWMHFM